MTDAFKNIMIGLFVFAAIVVIIFSLMFLNPNIGDNNKIVHVHFTDVDKVTPGTRVTLAGRPVGKVIDIQDIEHGRGGPTDSHGRIYLYDLTLEIDSGINIYNTDKIAARTSGLLGEKNIEITPYAPKPEEKLTIVDDKVIFAVETESIEDALTEVSNISEKFQGTLQAITDTIHRIRDEKLVEKITTTVDHYDLIAADIHRTWPSVDQSIRDFDKTVQHIGTTAAHANKSLNTVDSILANANKVMGHVAKGEGSLGKILVRDDLYLRITSILNKAETTMDDINHYGLLFHSDKGWQRLRARRLNLLQKLQSPQEFRNYFNDEVDQISTSLSRVYMVLNEFGENPYCGCLLDNPEYTKVFSELMRRVSMLDEEIKMYNAEVAEAESHQTEIN